MKIILYHALRRRSTHNNLLGLINYFSLFIPDMIQNFLVFDKYISFGAIFCLNRYTELLRVLSILPVMSEFNANILSY